MLTKAVCGVYAALLRPAINIGDYYQKNRCELTGDRKKGDYEIIAGCNI
jgi:hypothetical protein